MTDESLVVRNDAATCTAAGLVQAGVVHGGLHLHPPAEPRGSPEPRTSGTDAGRSTDELARRVEAQWRAAAAERGLVDRPLKVYWRWSDSGISGPPEDAVGDPGHVRFAPLPGLPRVGSARLARGEVGDLFGVYGGLDSGRIVLVGDAGSGKSGAMIRLLLDAVAHRAGLGDPAVRARVPVPVLLTAFDWVPDREGFVEWVTRRLEVEHRFLKTARGSMSSARALVDEGLVSVLLDGVDEMAPAARGRVLREVSRQARCRVVLSSRSRELAQAVTGGHLRGAAALELIPIEPVRAADHLALRVVHPVPAAWRTLIDRLRGGRDPALAGALDTPLMLGLLLDTYLPHDAVDELCDRERFPTGQTVEDHLLARVLPTAYDTHPGAPRPAYTLAQAERWLGFLAGQMNREDTRDLAWWRIGRWKPAWPRIAVSGVLVGLADGLACGFLFGRVVGLAVGLGVALLIFATGRLGADKYNRYPPQYHGLRWNRQSPRVALTFGLHFGPAGTLGFAAGVGATGGLCFWLALDSPVGGVVGGLIWVLMAAVAAVLTDALGTAHPTDGLLTPLNSWRGNSRMVVASGLAVGLANGVLCGGLSELLLRQNGFSLGVATAVTFGVPFAIRAGSPYAWSTMLTAAQLRRAGEGPRHTVRFLEDARARGVLRTAGPIYQFRHARLQDLLAG
ncbi:hypothetical protein [Actinokineospora enzanensis]|uniref:hypothetical protein n=1 Tax=Actinokineospora enzanensis TaxID=155975 RepID=UPI0006849ADB|nr:hypothetical protein [Actinokineospora enzanensis]